MIQSVGAVLQWCTYDSLTSLSMGTSRFLGMVAPLATTSAATVQYARGLFTCS